MEFFRLLFLQLLLLQFICGAEFVAFYFEGSPQNITTLFVILLSQEPKPSN